MRNCEGDKTLAESVMLQAVCGGVKFVMCGTDGAQAAAAHGKYLFMVIKGTHNRS